MTRLVLLLLLFSSLTSLAQTGHKLDFKVHGWKDTIVYLGHYQGETTVIRDTADVNSLGVFSFQGEKVLPCGVYFLVKKTPKANLKVFEFVVGDDQTFSLETSSPNYETNMKVAGDKDNSLFFENLDFSIARHAEAEPFIKILRDSSVSEDKKKEARQAYAKISDRVRAHQK